GWPRSSWACGAAPMASSPPMRLSRPVRVGPCTLQCGTLVVPSPISTPGPIQVNAPTDTPSPSRADGSTTAVGWMPAVMSGAHLGAEDVGAGHLLAVHPRQAAVERHVADLALEFDLQVEP